MKTIIVTAALILVIPILVQAQETDRQDRGQGYVFIGEGTLRDDGLRGITQVGGGGEVLLYKGFAVGGEFGAMGRPAEGVAVFSVDPSYHFLRASRGAKLVPFVEGGYTRAFGNNYPFPPSNLFNFGGGIHYWVFKRVGLRLEFRDHVYAGSLSGYAAHYWALRIGLAFR